MSGFDMSSTIVGIMGLLAIALLPTPYGVIVAVGAIVFCWGEIYSNRENIEQVDMVALVMGVAFLVGAFIGHTHLMVMFLPCAYGCILMLGQSAMSMIMLKERDRSEFPHTEPVSPEVIMQQVISMLKPFLEDMARHDQARQALFEKKLSDLSIAQLPQQAFISQDELDKRVNEVLKEAKRQKDAELASVRAEYENKECQLIAEYRNQYECNIKTLKKQYNEKIKKASDKAKKVLTSKYQAEIKRLETERETSIIAARNLLDEQKRVWEKTMQQQRGYEREIAQYKSDMQEQAKLVQELRENQDAYISQIQSLHESENKPLENEEIRKIFEDGLKSAKKELDVFSPWMNYRVVDEMMMDKFEALLINGVTVKIRYGFQDNNDTSNGNGRYNKTEKIANKLRERFGKYPKFAMFRDNSHAKLFICDDEYYVISSFNILSFDGNYEKEPGLHREIGEISHSKENLVCYRK